MRNKRTLQIQQLESKLRPFIEAGKTASPAGGWIRAIRTSLNMTMAQLGSKLNISKQGVKNLENSEAAGSITLNSIRDVGHAMDFDLVYALVPKDGSLTAMIQKKAEKLARTIVMRTNQSMNLENQAIEKDKIEESIAELAEELQRELRKSLWD